MRAKVTLNERGAIIIPAAMRRAFGLKANDELIIEETDQGLFLRLPVNGPIEIYSEERIAEFARDEGAIGRIVQR